MTVGVIDYQAGNLKSLTRAVAELGHTVDIVDSTRPCHETFSHLILPGVGSFYEGAKTLDESGLSDWIRERVTDGETQLLGICLGMHLLADLGNEGVQTREGLGLIGGVVERLQPVDEKERVPHMGWNELEILNSHSILANIPNNKDFFFAHSYHFLPANKDHVAAVTPYCNSLVSVLVSGNIFGIQFHPEKSSFLGRRILSNFLSSKSA